MNEKLILLLQDATALLYDYRSHRLPDNNKLTEHIEELKAALKKLQQGANPPLATGCEEADTAKMSERHEQEHLIYALHDVSKELIRTTGEIRSLLLVLSKLDLVSMEKVNMKISELSGGLAELKTSALKGFSEVRNRIDVGDARILVLEKALADADIPAEAETALADLKTIFKQLDDIVPDAPELPPVVNPPAPV